MGGFFRKIAGALRGQPSPSSLAAWTDVKASELFSWFGVHEVGREMVPSGGRVLHLEPGGYQESIDLWLEVGDDDGVRSARLVLDRAWADAPQTAPFALDLTKSALPVFAPRSAVVRELAERLIRQLRSMPVLTGAGALPPLPEPASAEMQAAIDAYLGRRDRAALADATMRLTVANGAESDMPKLTLFIEPPR